MLLRSGKTITISNMILEIREKVLIKRGRVPSLNIKTKNKIILHKTIFKQYPNEISTYVVDRPL